MSFFRKLFGLGPKVPVNTRRQNVSASLPKPEENGNEDVAPDINTSKIYPVLLSQKMTVEFDLEGEFYGVFYKRKDIFSPVITAHFAIGEVDEDGMADSFQLRTYNQEESYYHEIREQGIKNFEDFEVPFVDWKTTEKQSFKILSCGVSFFSPQKILSKKHMLEAHKMLDAEEILVSIPRRGLIFVCSKDLSEEDYNNFVSIHAGIVMQDNTNLEYLCEDIFVLKEGAITNVVELYQLSGMLNEKYTKV